MNHYGQIPGLSEEHNSSRHANALFFTVVAQTRPFPISSRKIFSAPLSSDPVSVCMFSHSFYLTKFPGCPRRHASTAIQPAESSSSTELRSAPSMFEPDTAFQQSRHGTTLARCNTAIHDAFKRRDIRSCFEAAANMKKNGIAPDATTYNSLLLATAYGTNSLDAFAVYEDMVSCGVEPNVATFNHLIFVSRCLVSGIVYSRNL